VQLFNQWQVGQGIKPLEWLSAMMRRRWAAAATGEGSHESTMQVMLSTQKESQYDAACWLW
jgi:hypothetical protein